MVTAFMRGRVKDYSQWRPSFDYFDPLRSASGVLEQAVYRSWDDPDEVLVVLRFRTRAEAEAYVGSSELKDAIHTNDTTAQVQIDVFDETTD